MLKKIILTAGVLMLAPTVWQAATAGLKNDTVFLTGITSGLLAYGWFFERLKKQKWLTALICVVILFFSALTVFITLFGLTENARYDEDVVLVLGGAVRGEEVTATLRKRLDRALAYYNKNPNALFVVTGGQGPREDIPEGLAMARYLIAGGIPQERILREESASSTYENMIFSKKLMDDYFNGDYSVVVVTSGFHLYRSVSFARQVGLNCTYLWADSPWYKWPGDYARECAAVVKLWLFKR